MIDLYSLQTKTIKFTIAAPDDTFDITAVTYGCRYHLLADGEWVADFKCPLTAMNEVAEHRTGLPRWDTSRVKASSESEKWTCHFDDRLRFKVVGDYLATSRRLSYREIDQYFHCKHPYLMDRMKLHSILEEMAVSGQLDNVPTSCSMIPAEFRRLHQRLEQWRKADNS